jgi:hypothetical protein
MDVIDNLNLADFGMVCAGAFWGIKLKQNSQ